MDKTIEEELEKLAQDKRLAEMGIVTTAYGEWQLCPKCNGQGTVTKPPHIPGDVNQWSSTATSFQCDVCNGAKVLIKPSLPVSDAENKWIEWYKENWLRSIELWQKEVEEIERLKDVLESIAESKYPESIFKMTDKDFEKVKKFLTSHNYSIDALSGYYGRIFQKIFIDQAKEALATIK